MAFAEFTDGHRQTIDHNKALAMWQIINGEAQGSEQQWAYIATVKRLYLDWYSAPESYKIAYPRVETDAAVRRDWQGKYD